MENRPQQPSQQPSHPSSNATNGSKTDVRSTAPIVHTAAPGSTVESTRSGTATVAPPPTAAAPAAQLAAGALPKATQPQALPQQQQQHQPQRPVSSVVAPAAPTPGIRHSVAPQQQHQQAAIRHVQQHVPIAGHPQQQPPPPQPPQPGYAGTPFPPQAVARPAAASWSVPNPLGTAKPPPPSQKQPQQQQQRPRTAHTTASPAQAAAPRPSYAAAAAASTAAAAAAPRRPSGVMVVPQPNQRKPKVVLSAEAKQALAKAIWSAIRSPTGTVDPELMRQATLQGLPEHAVRNAARVAREREALKRKQQQQQQAIQLQLQREQQIKQQQQLQLQQKQIQEQQKKLQQQRLEQQRRIEQQRKLQQQKELIERQERQRQQMLAQQRKIEEEKRKQLEQQRQAHAKAMERADWKRVHNGIFMVQKGRFQAMPFSVGAMIRTHSTHPVLKAGSSAHRSKLVQEALALQKACQERRSAGLSTAASKSPGPAKLLDPDSYKRVKVEPKKYSRALERAARKARQNVAEGFLKQYKELNKAISTHQTEFFKFHRQRKMDATKLAKMIRDSFEKEEKKKEKEEVAAERARLAALKANDMHAYTKLLEDTRNERLKFLLEKTERHFDEISNLLHQRTVGQGSMGQAPKAATSYYATAHIRTEDVRQPSILVGGDLKEYQLAGLQWLVSLYNNKLNGILADEMGLGKTIQAISLIAYLMEFKQNLGPFLVIVPLSTLSNWESEFHKWCPAARTICYKGTPVQRRDIYKDQVRAGHFNVLLTTYEYIIRDKKHLRKHVWQYAIVDEGHRMKNAASKFAVTLGTQYVTKYRILLTGTPLMNDLSELWSLLNFLLPSIFNSVSTFDQWFSAPFAQFSGNAEEQEQDLLTNEERVLIIHRLHELLRPFMLRRVKSEVLDQLPEKVEKVLRCDLSSWQKELYKQVSKKAVAENGLLDSTTTAPVPSRGLNNIVMQLRKVCNHPYLFTPDGYQINDNIIRSSGKLALLDQMLPKLKAAGHRLLMFTQMTAVMTILEDYFAYRGYLSLRLDGSTPADEREKRMYRFNAPDSPVFIFLLSTRAGGLGLNLTSADTVIIFDSDWNPAMDLQAQDRAHRIGQRSDVSVFRLITNSPVEEKILSRATDKMNVSQLVVESGKFNKESVDSDNSLERKRLMEVLLTDFDSAQPKAQSGISGSDQGDDDDDDAGSESSDKEDLNELLSNNEADYQLYEAFDKQQVAKGNRPAELSTSETDVPDWILHPPPGGTRSVFASVGDGSRKRKAVMYDDGLTEKQFMRLMDKQSIAEENARKKTKTNRGAARASQTSSVDDAESPEPTATVSAPLMTDWTYRKLISCSKSVVALKDPSTKRRLSEIFLEKPDPATFPDYYEVIEKPIAINDILRKCRAKIYATIPEFKDDWKLMFANARKFNGDDSWVVQDAVALEKELERVLKKNGFIDDARPPTCKEKKKSKIRIKLSLKKS